MGRGRRPVGRDGGPGKGGQGARGGGMVCVCLSVCLSDARPDPGEQEPPAGKGRGFGRSGLDRVKPENAKDALIQSLDELSQSTGRKPEGTSMVMGEEDEAGWEEVDAKVSPGPCRGRGRGGWGGCARSLSFPRRPRPAPTAPPRAPRRPRRRRPCPRGKSTDR